MPNFSGTSPPNTPPPLTNPEDVAADTIRVLVATDSHVGYKERDAERCNDSWRTFHEVLSLARERDVDMVLHAGDLFHQNNPSGQSMKHVMQSLRINCLGEKPCELELLSDATEQFGGHFDHVNYEDPDINVSIPFFAIHGNHDDPTGIGHLSSLDVLQASGLINYFGRIPEADKIEVKPVLLQKGNTKLALYGMSHVRDERLFRTFRDGNVKFFRPGTQQDDWFNLLAVHQNHHAYTDTGFLPETFLPNFMDLIVWGHEHKCEIDPVKNLEMGFHVMQPGSSVVTGLVPGESDPKYVSILTIKGKEFTTEKVRLKTVRPFVMREIVLAKVSELKKFIHKEDNRTEINRYLDSVITEMLQEARQQWREALAEVGGEMDEDAQPPKPIIRLRVEFSAPDNGEFKVDNAQRFSNKYHDRIANRSDVVQFHRRKRATGFKNAQIEDLDDDLIEQLGIDSIKVDRLVREFLTAQSLTILPQNSFSDALNQFIEKNDKTAMDAFVSDSLKDQVQHLVDVDENEELDEAAVEEMMAAYKKTMEDAFSKGEKKTAMNRKPKPLDWDSDDQGHWVDSILSLKDAVVEGEEVEEEEQSAPQTKSGRGARGGRRGKANGEAALSSSKNSRAEPNKASTKSTVPTKGRGKGKKRHVFEVSDDDDEEDDEGYDNVNDDEDDDDVIMIDDDDDDDDMNDFIDDGAEESDSQALFIKSQQVVNTRARSKAPATSKPAAANKSRSRAAPAKPSAGRTLGNGKQSQLAFGAPPSAQKASGKAATNGSSSRTAGKNTRTAPQPKRMQEPSEDEISDDDGAFAPVVTSTASRRGGRKR